MAEELDLRALARKVAEDQAQRRPAPALDLCDHPLPIRAETRRLEGVICHIVENAQEATDDEGNVTIKVFRDRDYAVVEVTDTGHGMDEGFIQNELFRPFSSTKENKGMGIGAYQARSVLRSLGGDIEVSSAPGQGSRFRLLFPAPKSINPNPEIANTDATHG